MNSYHTFVREFADSLNHAKRAEPESMKTRHLPDSSSESPRVLLFSPHPDDECIVGLLPLRMAAECGCHIVNVPVTHGSDSLRQAPRHAELMEACGYLEWEVAPGPVAVGDAPYPPFEPEDVGVVLKQLQPEVVFFPHNRDWNSRHLWTHTLLMDALRSRGAEGACTVVETEFWGAMDDPNLMVEATPDHLGDLVTALSFHAGEVARNPYHRSLPSWMVDNVRRGAERIAGQGNASPDFMFATLYRVSKWDGHTLTPLPPGTLPASQSPVDLFLS